MTAILEDLAAGRIDAAEAARRIDALKAAEQADSRRRAGTEAPRSPATRSWPPSDVEQRRRATPWAAATDRPQHATLHHRELHHSPSPTRRRSAPAQQAGQHQRCRADHRTGGRSPGADRRRDLGGHPVRRRAARAAPQRRRCWRCPATVSWARPWTGSASCKAPRATWTTSARSGSARSCSCGSTPNIEVDVEVTGGSLNTERVPHLGKVRVTAGGAKLLDVERDQRRADPGRSGHDQGRHHHRSLPDPGRVGLAVDRTWPTTPTSPSRVTRSSARSAGPAATTAPATRS